jgi:ParB family chromosome partitioning protein
VEAKIFQEKNFSTEDFFNISLAENTKRRNLNPVEIGNFLEAASKTMGLNNTLLAERFGETLGIGTPGQLVSHSTVHKYRKVNQIRERGESPEIINDVINENLSFSIVAEVLAPIKSASDRNSLYVEIIKPLAPTRPQLVKILSLLKRENRSLKTSIQKHRTKQIIKSAMESNGKASTFIKLYQQEQSPSSPMDNQQMVDKINSLRKTYFGSSATKKVFDLTCDKSKTANSYNLKVNITAENYQEVLDKVKDLLHQEQLLKPD